MVIERGDWDEVYDIKDGVDNIFLRMCTQEMNYLVKNVGGLTSEGKQM